MDIPDYISEDLERIILNCNIELSKLAGQNLLLTGCAGFLGYYFSLVFAYWNQNYENKIACTFQDNFIRGTPTWLGQIAEVESISVEDFDVLNKYENFEFMNVIHAASIASPTYYRKFPIETMDANVNGLRNLLENQQQFKKNFTGKTNFLYFSTSEIYGDPPASQIPTSEEYRGHVSCTGPRACYDESKRYGETLCINFVHSRELRVTIARPFNNYGPGLSKSDGRVIPDFASSMLQDNKITMFSDGSPTRTFCYISDAIEGYIKVLMSGTSGDSYNIGTDQPEISMLQLASSMKDIYKTRTGRDTIIERQISTDKDYLVDSPNRRCPDITKAKRELNFNPSVSFEQGLEKTMKYYGMFE
jgi:nucleoside-diphosphate-sugar epimerase